MIKAEMHSTGVGVEMNGSMEEFMQEYAAISSSMYLAMRDEEAPMALIVIAMMTLLLKGVTNEALKEDGIEPKFDDLGIDDETIKEMIRAAMNKEGSEE